MTSRDDDSFYKELSDGSTSEYILLNNLGTRVRCWGGHITKQFPEELKDPLLLCFTGNPGVTSFYITFLRTIHKETGIRICIISQAGHDLPTESYKISEERLYNLKEQVEHKQAFIRKYIPKRVPLVLLGHSIGAYIILELLRKDDQIAHMVQKAYCLFPTIENMRVSPSGYKFETYFKRLNHAVIFLSWLFSNFIPVYWRKKLIKLYFYINSYNEDLIDSIVELIQPPVLKQVIYMASDEMDKVTDLDFKTLEKYAEKLRFFYGSSDGWVPITWPHNMIEQIPSLTKNTVIDLTGFQHAFVLKDSERMANIITSWLKEDLNI